MFHFETWKDHLQCPQCGAALESSASQISCVGCRSAFPLLDGVPVLQPQPMHLLGEWRGRYELLLRTLERDRTNLLQQLDSIPPLVPSTKHRLTHLAKALADQTTQITALLAALKMGQRSYDWLTAMKFRLPPSQTLNNYYPNVFRDWAWGGAENRSSVESLKSLGENAWGHTLILGSGSGRLAYDIATEIRPTATLATDINPFLLTVAAKLYRGETITLWEFPLSPSTPDHSAVRHELRAPGAAPQGILDVAYVDVFHPALKAESFETVVTPWLVDILPENARLVSARINRLLKPGGQWLWNGPTGFRRARQSELYTVAEVKEVVTEAGFTIHAALESRHAYLASPFSAHHRVENVLSFRAEKIRTISFPTRPPGIPDWITDLTLPIPKEPLLLSLQKGHEALAECLREVDGKKSIADLAKHLANRHGVDASASAESMIQLFIKLYDDSPPGTFDA